MQLKKVFSAFMALVMLSPSIVYANINVHDYNFITTEGYFDFDSTTESVIEAFGRANPFVDLSSATITEEVDVYGNMVYVIETPRRTVNNVYDVSLSDIAYIFLNDPTVVARFYDNILTYTLPDGTEGKMIETINNDGTRALRSIEGEKDMELVIDMRNQEVLIDGTPVIASVSEAFTIYQEHNLVQALSTQWNFFMETRPDIQFERAIAELTTGLFLATIGAFINPWIGFSLAVVTSVMTFLTSINPRGRSIYVTRRLYMRQIHFPTVEMRAIDRFFSNPNRTNFVAQTTTFFSGH